MSASLAVTCRLPSSTPQNAETEYDAPSRYLTTHSSEQHEDNPLSRVSLPGRHPVWGCAAGRTARAPIAAEAAPRRPGARRRPLRALTGAGDARRGRLAWARRHAGRLHGARARWLRQCPLGPCWRWRARRRMAQHGAACGGPAAAASRASASAQRPPCLHAHAAAAECECLQRRRHRPQGAAVARGRGPRTQRVRRLAGLRVPPELVPAALGGGLAAVARRRAAAAAAAAAARAAAAAARAARQLDAHLEAAARGQH
jgi:hypothetical protein